MTKEQIFVANVSSADNIYTNLPQSYKQILKAMEEYALQASKDGFCAGSDAVHKILRPDIDRLKELVKAQKELIEELVTYTPYSMRTELRNRIKQLEQ